MGDDAFHFSVTIACDDLALVCCLRGLSTHRQGDGNVDAPWRGTGRREWTHNGNRVTFRFTSSRLRGDFIADAKRLFPFGSWHEVSRDDADAPPQP